MAVITLSREPYSGGSALGEAVAKQLGYTLIARDDFFDIFREYGLITFDYFYSTPLNIWERINDVQNDYMTFLKKVIRNIGFLGNTVILGRGSFAVFPDFSDVLNVRLWAPLETRIQRCMEKGHLDHEHARVTVEEQDKIRHSFISHCFHVHQSSMQTAFDLVLNTGKITENETNGMIVAAALSLEGSDQKTGRTTKEIKPDSILLDTIKKVIAGKED
ncbi:MAG: cytidylate kinase-like family protein [Bacteroidetes bacterium]|nr:cytidylate kinase-like family protein [Bacteroidota bacterium]